MSEKEEDNIGKTEHPKIVKQFGGIYENIKLQNYIESLGDFLVSTSELPEKKFTFTILDTPIVNAFALPGGFIYLTRGLIYLCQNEAQLAGVIAHEIGHVTAKHTAKRYTQAFGTNLLMNLLGAIAKNQYVSNLIGQSASLYLLSYSRGQEYEADNLATRYMIRAGFDPNQMAHFLSTMELLSELNKRIFKIPNNSELLQTHPSSSKRVSEVIFKSKEKIPINPIIGEQIFLKKIDGMLFGNKESEGFFLGNKFIHKSLGIMFEFSNDFYFKNNPNYLYGVTDEKTKVIFDVKQRKQENNRKYLAKWANISENKIKNFKSYVRNNLKFSFGESYKSGEILILGAISDNVNFYRFMMISEKKEINRYKEDFFEMLDTFKKIKESEKLAYKAPRIKIMTFDQDNFSLNKISNSVQIQRKYSKEYLMIINNIKKKQFRGLKKLKLVY